LVSLEDVRRKYLSSREMEIAGFRVSSAAPSPVGVPTPQSASNQFRVRGRFGLSEGTIIEKARKVSPVCARSVDRAIWCLFLVGEWRGIPPYSFPDDLKPVLMKLLSKDKVPMKVKEYLRASGILKSLRIEHGAELRELARDIQKIVKACRKGFRSEASELIRKVQKRLKGRLPQVLTEVERHMGVRGRDVTEVIKELKEATLKGTTPEATAQTLITKLRQPLKTPKPAVITQQRKTKQQPIKEGIAADVMTQLKKSLKAMKMGRTT